MSDDESFEVRSDTGPWAVVPGWVINADINDKALRLYALLSLFADGGTRNGGTTRNRKGLAAKLGCSVDTIDRASASLEEIGAIKRLAHFDRSGDQGANRWIVYRVPPGGRESAAGGSREDAAPKRSRPPIDPNPQIPLVSDEAFENFWEHFPRHTDKGGARKAWAKAIKKVSGDGARLQQAAARYAHDPNLPEPQFIPHASTWLNGERWNDGPLPPRSKGRVQPRTADRAMQEDPHYWDEPSPPRPPDPTNPDDPSYWEES